MKARKELRRAMVDGTQVRLCRDCFQHLGEGDEQWDERLNEKDLRWVLIGDSQVLLCPRCRKENAAWYDEELDELLNDPVTFPPGVMAVEHVCPELEWRGKSAEEAIFILHLEREGDYYEVACPFCDVRVRSLAPDDEFDDLARAA